MRTSDLLGLGGLGALALKNFLKNVLNLLFQKACKRGGLGAGCQI